MRHTKATRLKCRLAKLGRPHTPESRAKIAASLKGRFQARGAWRKYVPNPASVRVPVGMDLAYMAGIVDGEGSIRTRIDTGRPFLAVYNTDKRLMDWLEQRTGRAGRITDRRGRVPCYTWIVQGVNDVVALCEALLPHLVIKKTDAEKAIAVLRGRYGR